MLGLSFERMRKGDCHFLARVLPRDLALLAAVAVQPRDGADVVIDRIQGDGLHGTQGREIDGRRASDLLLFDRDVQVELEMQHVDRAVSGCAIRRVLGVRSRGEKEKEDDCRQKTLHGTTSLSD
jgi:hypothetical protein